MSEKKLSGWYLMLAAAVVLSLSTVSSRARDFTVNAPSNQQAIYLAGPDSVKYAATYGTNIYVAPGAVLQRSPGQFVLLMHSGSTNVTSFLLPDASLTIHWLPVTDSGGNVWRRITSARTPRYVQNLSSGVVYVAHGTTATNGLGIALLAGDSPDYVGGAVTFNGGEITKDLSVWIPAGGKVGYGE